MNYILYREGDASPPDIVQQMKQPIELVKTKTDKLNALEGPGVVFRFGTTATVPVWRERSLRIVNTAAAIHLAYNKAGTRKWLAKAHVPVPPTWFDMEEARRPRPDNPLIVRPQTHGRQSEFHVVHNLRELVMACDKCGPGYYISEYIPKIKEYRVHVCNGRALAVTDKVPHNPHAYAWGVRDITWTNVRWSHWPIEVAEEACRATTELGLQWAAVDVIVNAVGEVFVLELNTAPHLSWYETTCYARAFDWMIERQVEDKDIPKLGIADAWREPVTWKHYIHPCNTQEAIV